MVFDLNFVRETAVVLLLNVSGSVTIFARSNETEGGVREGGGREGVREYCVHFNKNNDPPTPLPQNNNNNNNNNNKHSPGGNKSVSVTNQAVRPRK